MKVVLVSPAPPPYGGIANWTRLISQYIQTKSTEIQLMHINIAPTKRNTEGRNIYDRVFVSGFEMLGSTKRLKQVIKDENPDVIHITTSGQLAIIRDIALLKIAKKRKIPTVYHIRFGRLKYIAEKNTPEFRLLKKAISLASATMAIDRDTYKAAEEYIPSARIIYCPNPVDLVDLMVLSRTEFSKSVLFLGWVVKTKGIEELLEAWNHVHDINPDWTLKIAGPCNSEYLEKINEKFELNGVVYLGELKHEDAMQELVNSDIFVLPSYTEGFPNVVIEAMALKKPVIATAVGAVPDILSENAGVVIKPCDIQALTESLENLIIDGEKRCILGNNAFDKAFTEYSIEKVFALYKRAWQEVIDKK